MPGARSMWVVAMKFTPVAIEEKPATNTPSGGGEHVRVREHRRERGVEGPAGVDAAGDQRIERAATPPAMLRYQLNRLSRGKATSGAPIISGSRKLPSVAGIDGTRKNHTITMPWKVKSLL